MTEEDKNNNNETNQLSLKDQILVFTNKIIPSSSFSNRFSISSNHTVLSIIIFILFIIFVFISFTVGRYYPNPQSEIIQNLINKALETEKSKYEIIIKEKNNQMTNILIKLNDSQNQVLLTQKELDKIKKQIQNIKPPENEKEIRERLKDLGYETY